MSATPSAHPWDQPSRRRPVIPGWLRDRQSRGHAVRWAGSHVTHLTLFHAARIHLYLLRLAVCFPVGLVRFAHWHFRWVWDRHEAGTRDLAITAAASGDHSKYATMARIRKDRVRTRMLGTAVTGLLLLVLTLAMYLAWRPGAYLLAGLAVLGLAYLGRPADGSIVDHAVITPAAERLTPDVITRALGSLGLAGINQALRPGGPGIQFIAPGVGRSGPGWEAHLDLPRGVTVTEVLERRDKLSAGLRRPLACVWPVPDPGVHEGRMVLHILDKPMRDMPPAAWPLAVKGTADLFRPAPLAVDQRGRPVPVLLMYAGVLVGSKPRMGKTMAIRLLTLYSALDPRAELHVWELKGTGDLSSAAHVAVAYGSGADDGTLADCLEDVRAVAAELDKRAAVIRGLPRDLCPENKVTPELAAKRSLGLHPLVLVISECQEAFGHRQLGRDFDQLVSAIVKRGPALGVIPLLDTQRPDADSLPGGIRANIGVRFCLRVMDWQANDMVLPGNSFKNGLRATEFAEDDKGIGWLTGHASDPAIVRTCYLDAVQADQIGRRARRMREEAGTLAGYAAGEQEKRIPVVDFLGDVAAVTEGLDTVWSETIAARLAELRPGVYRGWDATTAGDALRVRGVPIVQVWGQTSDGQKANRRGVSRAAVLAAREASSNGASRETGQ